MVYKQNVKLKKIVLKMCTPSFNAKYAFIDNVQIRILFNGLSEDLETLRRDFLSSDSTSFFNFAEVWKKHRFASIFCERYSLSDLIEFTEGVFHYLKGYIFSLDQLSTIFGIYLAYAVYHKHMLPANVVKLRMTFEELKEFKPIFKKLHDDAHLEAVYIFRKMLKSSAIHFVVTSMDKGIEPGHRKYFKCADEDDGNLLKEEPGPPFDVALLDSYEDILQTYTTNKNIAFNDDEVFDNPSDFVDNMRTYFSYFGQDSFPFPNVKTEAELSVPGSSSDTGKSRRKLKQTAFQRGSSTATAPASAVEESSTTSTTTSRRTPASAFVELNTPTFLDDAEC